METKINYRKNIWAFALIIFLRYFRPWNGVEVDEDAMQKSSGEKRKKERKKIGWARAVAEL